MYKYKDGKAGGEVLETLLEVEREIDGASLH
jgi:hypothetical protein